MSKFIPLTGFLAATWPSRYAANQLIGLRIVTDRFVKRGVLPGDFAAVLKKQFAKDGDKIRDGDLIVIADEDGVEISEYSSKAPTAETLLGKIVRIWRDY
jgi:hypothetical protein